MISSRNRRHPSTATDNGILERGFAHSPLKEHFDEDHYFLFNWRLLNKKLSRASHISTKLLNVTLTVYFNNQLPLRSIHPKNHKLRQRTVRHRHNLNFPFSWEALLPFNFHRWSSPKVWRWHDSAKRDGNNPPVVPLLMLLRHSSQTTWHWGARGGAPR